MKYNNCHSGIFIFRPNRFIAMVEIDGREEKVHVKNTGRCRELLQPGNTVYLEKSGNPARKTAYDLIAVEKQVPGGTMLINMDSMAPNRMARDWILSGGLGEMDELRSEVTIGSSRYDFAGRERGRDVVIEVKGCTLEQGGVARFPDAPTQRGVKHVLGLAELARQGCRCIVLIVVQMADAQLFRPNWETHPEFGRALIQAQEAGVEIIAVNCRVAPGFAEICGKIAVNLQPDFGIVDKV